ncbi:response regulator transcription factor [Spirosoma sp. KCTC 42546]|uniref:LytR/AlgR family response regulator transcription factor n=1 Tax=Spirosoma sp. KCTC 42546 TaxID=2520506 RepID=UPI00115BE2EA|nr:LytTR family DNA-binding domain-containing protein [Spirosoma sp. KCTC 42546]QDK79870.1 response regulator transcription factor [Spirosoma sp. KCTC 42546]
MIKAILIDDEAHCLDTLSILLADHCPEVTILQTCRSAKTAIEAIEQAKPDVIFLDIQMPGTTGFQLLEQLGQVSFAVIFTTSYDQYAIKAIHLSALDYLLKPVDPAELIVAVDKVKRQKAIPSPEHFELLFDRLHNKLSGFRNIAIPTLEGFEFIPVDQLIFCEADDNYTYLILKDKRKVIASRTLKAIEEQLREFPYFVRVHHSYIVNINEVTKYVRGEGGYLIMSDSSVVNVSRSRKEALLKLF